MSLNSALCYEMATRRNAWRNAPGSCWLVLNTGAPVRLEAVLPCFQVLAQQHPWPDSLPNLGSKPLVRSKIDAIIEREGCFHVPKSVVYFVADV